MSAHVQFCLYENLEDLESIRAAWEELLASTPTATIFSTWEWLVPWWRAFGERQKLVILAFFDSSKRLVGLAPLSLITRRVSAGFRLRLLRMMGDGSHDSDNLDFPVRSGCEVEFSKALVEYLQEQEDLWDLAQLNTLPANSAAGNFLLRHLKELGWTHFVYKQPSSAIVLPGSWEAYLNKLSSKERRKLRYYQQRLEKRYDVRFYKCTHESELPTRLDTLFELHRKRWQLRGEAGSFGSAARRQFYYEMARSFLGRRWLEFWMLELNGQAVAAQFGFRYGETTYALQEGFDPAYSADSVGYVLRGHVLKQAIAEGVRRYDFLAGQDVSKDRWGTQEGTYLHIHFAKPFSRGSVYLRLVHNVRKRKERLRAHLPSRAWALLRSLYRRLQNRRVQEREPPFG